MKDKNQLEGGEMVKKKVKNSENHDNIEKEEKEEMAKRRRIGSKCYLVRERNTSAGRKGTIIKKCPKPKSKKRKRSPPRRWRI